MFFFWGGVVNHIGGENVQPPESAAFMRQVVLLSDSLPTPWGMLRLTVWFASTSSKLKKMGHNPKVPYSNGKFIIHHGRHCLPSIFN